MLNLALTARYLGFEAVGIKTDYVGLSKIPLPALAHVNNNHYLMLINVMADSVLLEDGGKLFFEKREKFLGKWVGNILLVYPKTK
jgi:ABC-type bacteriocin/lantibiotic exporter with double-glycine peptidase domain